MSSHQVSGAAALECDALVIGSGAGGACVADVLSAAGLDVLIVEEGPYLPHQRVPAEATQSFLSMWRCAGLTAALGAPPVAYAEGRCVGGGTEINSAIFQRLPEELMDQWARRYAIADFNADALTPYFDRAAHVVNASATQGPLGRASEILREGAEQLGWQSTPLMRGQRDCVGTNLCSYGCPTGGKQSMTATLIPQAVARGARLVARCRITALVRKGNRIVEARGTAIDVTGAKQPIRIRADRVFACAGAIHTPALLLRSRLKGPIGRTLRLHPTIKVMASFDDEVGAADARLPLYAVTEFMPDLRIGGSVTTPGIFGMGLMEDWPRRKRFFEDFSRIGSYYAMARAAGRGRIRPLPGASEPLVSYKLEPGDWKLIHKGLDALVRLMFAAGARHVVPSIQGHQGWDDLGSARSEIAGGLPRSRVNLMTIHLFSSCPMGEDHEFCPVDSYGRVDGFSNLWIADASLIPEAPGVNPQGTVMALAYRVADHALH